MKILYGINTNGQGHINRARVFINELMNDGHEVHVLLSGKEPPAYAYKIAPVTFFKRGPIDIYKDHKLKYMKTYQVNLAHLGELTKNRRDLLELAHEEDYDVIFTDFEPTVSVAGRALEKTLICIDHQHSAFHPSNEIAPAKAILRLRLRNAIRFMVPYYSHCFTIDFAQEISRVGNETLFPLIWKPEFDNFTPTIGDHYLVYLARYNVEEMVKVLNQFPDDNFIIYGSKIDRDSDYPKNLQFKESDRQGFINDLVSCRGVITNAGFSLAWEACLLKKMIWMIPHINNYEQLTNAYRMKKLNRAFITEKLTFDNTRYFITRAEQQDFIPSVVLPVLQPSILMDQAYSYIKEFENKEK